MMTKKLEYDQVFSNLERLEIMIKVITTGLLGLLIGMTMGFLLLLVFPKNSEAATSCNRVSIVSTGTTLYTESGIFVKVRNDSGVNCGDFLYGTVQSFFLRTEDKDISYSTVLTALAMGRQMFLQVAGDAEEGSLVNVVSITPDTVEVTIE